MAKRADDGAKDKDATTALEKAILGRWESRYMNSKPVVDATQDHFLNITTFEAGGGGSWEGYFVRDGKKTDLGTGKIQWTISENGISMKKQVRGKDYTVTIKDLNDNWFKEWTKAK